MTMNGRVRLRWMDRKTNPDAPEAHAPPTRLQGLAVEVLGEVIRRVGQGQDVCGIVDKLLVGGIGVGRGCVCDVTACGARSSPGSSVGGGVGWG